MVRIIARVCTHIVFFWEQGNLAQLARVIGHVNCELSIAVPNVNLMSSLALW